MGWARSSYPFVTLRIEADRVVLASPLSTSVIDRQRLRRIILRRGLFRFLASELRFEHDQAGLPERVLFWTFRPADVIESLQAADYGELL